MTTYFLDTSTLARRYEHELGTAWVKSWIAPEAQHTIIISELATVEMLSVLVRRHRDGHITLEDFEAIRDDFLLHVDNQYLVIPLTGQTISLARELIVKHPLRTLDAMQLASALLAAQAQGEHKDDFPVFVCADKRLLDVARAGKLQVDNPTDHN